MRKTKHGMCDSREYVTWTKMLSRCRSKSNDRWKRYGGRGIKVCDRWLESFLNFYEDMGERPKGTSLDRIDNDKGYYKGNCRWATPQEQSNNTISNRFLTYNGKTQTVAQWREEGNFEKGTFCARIRRGWSMERALNQKVQKRRR